MMARTRPAIAVRNTGFTSVQEPRRKVSRTRARAFAVLVAVAGCHTTGGKVAGGIAAVGLGTEAVGAARGNDAAMSTGLLVTTVAALAWVTGEAQAERGPDLPSSTRSDAREITCRFGDCSKAGWTERYPDGTTLTCTCNFGDCNANGASCH